MITVDEAHCISMWGYGFRHKYLAISEFINKLEKRPIITAFTATATAYVQDDIVKLLDMKSLVVVKGNIIRKNLKLTIKHTSSKMHTLYAFLAKNKDKCGIIYCSWIESIEDLYKKLKEKNYKAEKYYGQMSAVDKQTSFDRFNNGESNIMIATNALPILLTHSVWVLTNKTLDMLFIMKCPMILKAIIRKLAELVETINIVFAFCITVKMMLTGK